MTSLVDLPTEEFDDLRPAVADEVTVRHYDDGVIAWSPSNPRPAPLEGVAAVIFQLVDGSATVAELVGDIHQVVGVPEAVARSQLRQVLDRLATDGLLAGMPGHRIAPTKLDLFPAPPNP